MPSTTFTSTPHASSTMATTAMAPLSPVHKCITLRKRQRASAYQLISDDDEFAAEQLSLSEEELEFDLDEAAASGYASSCSSSSSSKRMRRAASMTQEISGMQSSVRLMEKQVAQASASMQELHSLVQQLAAQRQQQSVVQCTA